MPYKRIIPSVLLRQGNAIKGKQFNSWRAACDFDSYMNTLNIKQADEIVVLTIDSSPLSESLSRLKKTLQRIYSPIAYGGGIRSSSDISLLMDSGVDRLILGNLITSNPDSVKSIISTIGSQACIASINVIQHENEFYLYNPTQRTMDPVSVYDFLSHVFELGFSEAVLTSVNHDGLQGGCSMPLLDTLDAFHTDTKILFSGGIGSPADAVPILLHPAISGVLVGSSLIYSRYTLHDYHTHCVSAGCNVRDLSCLS